MTSFEINGRAVSVRTPEDAPLLWAIRDELGLKGTKFGCGIGLCGACTIHVAGRATRSCITSVGAVAGASITTIEGLDPNGRHPLQMAWVELQVPRPRTTPGCSPAWRTRPRIWRERAGFSRRSSTHPLTAVNASSSGLRYPVLVLTGTYFRRLICVSQFWGFSARLRLRCCRLPPMLFRPDQACRRSVPQKASSWSLAAKPPLTTPSPRRGRRLHRRGEVGAVKRVGCGQW
jgi:hypothetical protein